VEKLRQPRNKRIAKTKIIFPFFINNKICLTRFYFNKNKSALSINPDNICMPNISANEILLNK